MEETKTSTIAEELGAFHFTAMLVILALLIMVALIGVLSRIKGNRVTEHCRLAFMLGITVFFWSQMWASSSLYTIYIMRSNPNMGFAPGLLEKHLSEIHGVNTVYFGLAFCFVVLSIGLAIIDRIGVRTDLAQQNGVDQAASHLQL